MHVPAPTLNLSPHTYHHHHSTSLLFPRSAVDELLLYRLCREAAMLRARSHPALASALGGGPLAEAAWYNASLSSSRDGTSASCTIPVSGAKAGSDVVVRVLRAEGGLMPRLLYNALGPGRWEVLTCDALLPAGGGLPRRLSLLDAAPGVALAGDVAVSRAHADGRPPNGPAASSLPFAPTPAGGSRAAPPVAAAGPAGLPAASKRRDA